jgi:hypothetical protein
MSAHHERILFGCSLAIQTSMVGGLAWLARADAPPSYVVIGLLAMFVPYVGAIVWSRSLAPSMSRRIAVVAACLLGTLFMLAPPILSDDVYRYIWEGRLWLEGVNPYQLPPNDPSLEPLRDVLWEPINNKPLASIYPPVLQLLFVLGAIFGAHVWTIKLLALLGLVVAVVAVGRVAKRAVAPLALALNPLMLSETALNGHFDVLVGAVLLLAAWSLAKQRYVQAGFAICVAVGLKVVGVVLLPLLGGRRVAQVVAICASVLLLLPVFAFRPPLDPVSGPGQFAARWQGNDSLFAIANWIGHRLADEPAADLVARLIVGLVLATVTVVLVRNRVPPLRAARTLVWSVLLLSPQVHPWYLGWLLPLELVAGGRAGVVWSALVLVAYAPLDRWVTDGVWHMPYGLQLGEYVLLWVALMVDNRRPSFSQTSSMDQFSSNLMYL